jgi:membrane associated rhomboid family serine protease
MRTFSYIYPILVGLFVSSALYFGLLSDIDNTFRIASAAIGAIVGFIMSELSMMKYRNKLNGKINKQESDK